jgi:hypothetical protein
MPENAKYWRSRIANLSCFLHGILSKPGMTPQNDTFAVPWCISICYSAVPFVRVLADLTRARAVRKAYTIVEARMAYRMIV